MVDPRKVKEAVDALIECSRVEGVVLDEVCLTPAGRRALLGEIITVVMVGGPRFGQHVETYRGVEIAVRQPEALTIETLVEIEGRADAATPGPWSRRYEDGGSCSVWSETVPTSNARVADGMTTQDSLFVAQAREDIPLLLAEIRRLRTLLAAQASSEDG